MKKTIGLLLAAITSSFILCPFTVSADSDKALSFEEFVAVDNDVCSITITDIDADNLWGYTLNLFINNKTNANLMIGVDEASVNGFMIDPFFATNVNAGKCEFTSVSWSDSALEENGITDVQEIELLLKVSDYDDWMAEDYVNERIVINP